VTPEARQTGNTPPLDGPYSLTPAWLDLCSSLYGYETRSLPILENGRAAGSLSFCVVRSRLFGTRLISMPFSDETGILLAPGASAASARNAVAAALDAAAAETGADYAELRGADQLFPDAGPDERFTGASPYIRLVLDTTRPYEELRNSFHVNLIKNLRKADRHVRVRETRNPADFAPVYGIYLRQMRQFGSPPLPAEHFERLLGAGLGRLFIASVGDSAAAILFAIERDGTFFADVNAGLPEFRAFFPKIRLFDETIRLACRAGLRRYDFMRTRPGSGVYGHKMKWGGTEIPINYYFRVYRGTKKPELDPEQKRFALGRLLLRHAPAALLRRLGPALRRHAGK